MTIVYSNGESIEPGDRVVYRDQAGSVEFVISGVDDHSQASWYLQQFPGGGVMVMVPVFGSVFIDAQEVKEELVFVAHAGEGS